MGDNCQAAAVNNRERAWAAVRQLGVRRVARWCQIGAESPYKWPSRATENHPIPSRHAVTILTCAAREGVAIDPHVFMPGWVEAA